MHGWLLVAVDVLVRRYCTLAHPGLWHLSYFTRTVWSLHSGPVMVAQVMVKVVEVPVSPKFVLIPASTHSCAFIKFMY